MSKIFHAKIDEERLPERALLDTEVLARGLRSRRHNDPRSVDSRDFIDAMIAHGKQILIAAPSLVELQRKFETPIPRTRAISVVAFDLMAAEVLAKEFPNNVLRAVSKGEWTAHYVKFDSLILATATRYKADVVVCFDGPMRALAARVDQATAEPGDFRDSQGEFRGEHFEPPDL